MGTASTSPPCLQPNTAAWSEHRIAAFLAAGDLRDNKLDCEAVARECEGPVLDAGCAFGMLSNYISGSGCSYIGVDWSKLAVQEARRQCARGVILWGNALSLGEGWFKSVDTVVAMQFLEHFADPRAVFVQLRKYARAQVIITVPRGMPVEGNTEGHVSGWANEGELIDMVSNGARIRAYPLEGDPAHIGVVAWW